MAVCEFGIIMRVSHGKKTGLDHFMAVCEFDIITRVFTWKENVT